VLAGAVERVEGVVGADRVPSGIISLVVLAVSAVERGISNSSALLRIMKAWSRCVTASSTAS